MIEGLYSAASGMEAQQQTLEAISNDLANADTAGYQSQRIGFEDLLYNGEGSATAAGVTIGTGTQAVSLGTSQVAGPIEQTGQPLDLAISGDAYFEVKQADGSTALTRDGSFQLDAKGQLTTLTGQLVQPPITVPSGTTAADLKVSANGDVVDGAKTLGRIALVTVPAPEQLTQAGGNLLLPNAASGAVRAAVGSTVEQGALNGSNVSTTLAMTEMMSAQQGYDLASRAITMEQQMLQIANGIKP
jgi:flagellar basal-body rod protein FlgG